MRIRGVAGGGDAPGMADRQGILDPARMAYLGR